MDKEAFATPDYRGMISIGIDDMEIITNCNENSYTPSHVHEGSEQTSQIDWTDFGSISRRECL